MNYYFSEEFFNDALVKELSPLTELSWVEANCAPNTNYDPDWNKYTQLNELNILRLFTVRNIEHELVGYITFVVTSTLHSSGVKHAAHDSLYILKPNRKNGTVKSLLEFIEKELKQDDIDTMEVSVMTHRDFSQTLKGLGFRHSESSYIKRIA